MNGPTRSNPSRKSRFRPPESGLPRRVGPAGAAPDTAADDPAAIGVAGEVAADDPAPPAPAAEPALPPPDARGVWSGAPETLELPEETGAGAAPPPPPSAEPSGATDATDELPAGFRLRNVYEGPTPMRPGVLAIYLTMGTVTLLTLGALMGYSFASRNPAVRPVPAARFAALPGTSTVPNALSAETQAQIDAAFSAVKEHRYDDAKQQFAALHDAHPEWPSMAIESARATLYALDGPATLKTLATLTRSGPLPDAEFLTALLHMTHKEYDTAIPFFDSAVALDPARADFYYFWGECLRGQGKPREAAQRFRSAALRNQYETAQDLYQLKLWMSQIQADEEESSGANAEINAGLAMKPRPPYSAVFAAAAREIKAGRYKEAAAFLTQARQLTEPVVFQVIVQDPTFEQEKWQPEMEGFFK